MIINKKPKTSHYVYKFVLNNKVIYVGKSNTNNFDRIFQHGRSGDNIKESGWDDINNSDIYYAPLYNEQMVDVVESELIRRYKPKYNIGKSNTEWIGIEIFINDWIPVRIGNSEEIATIQKENDKFKQIFSKYKNPVLHIYNLENRDKQKSECIKRLQSTIKELENKQKDAISDYASSEIRALENTHRRSTATNKMNGLTIRQVLHEYKCGRSVDYISICKDLRGNIDSVKHVYSVIDRFAPFPSLLYRFAQVGVKEVSGRFYNEPYAQAIGLNVLSKWEFKGSTQFYPIDRNAIDPESVFSLIAQKNK